ncbi:MAG: sugar transferase [Bacteroidaceae bacterium]|nr:sugar transferase [Bacteroidaceae bacterium]
MSETNTTPNTIDHMNALERGLKRVGDIIGALSAMMILWPVFLVVYVLLKSDGTPSVLFCQERIGRGGKPFNLFKFRTMCDEKEDEPILAEDNDERLTPHGRFLRKHHLDELPQLWNVLIGDMSLVGYRPERQYFIDKIMAVNPDYQLLYCSRPGITSYAAIHNGYTYTMAQMQRRLDLDLEYLRQRTLLLDIKILFETLAAL